MKTSPPRDSEIREIRTSLGKLSREVTFPSIWSYSGSEKRESLKIPDLEWKKNEKRECLMVKRREKVITKVMESRGDWNDESYSGKLFDAWWPISGIFRCEESRAMGVCLEFSLSASFTVQYARSFWKILGLSTITVTMCHASNFERDVIVINDGVCMETWKKIYYYNYQGRRAKKSLLKQYLLTFSNN